MNRYLNKLQSVPPADQLSALVMAGMGLVIVLTFRDYGLGWDEPFHEHYGTLIWDFISSGGVDQRVNTFRNLKSYGGLYDGLGALLAKAVPMEPFHTHHLLNAATGLLGAAGVWAMARAMSNPWAGFWALVVLLAVPSYTGHIFINPKDIPFAVGTIWTLYFAMRTFSALPKGDMRAALGLGAALGATMGVRIGGGVLVVYLLVLLALHVMWKQGRAREAVGIKAISLAVLVVATVSFVLTFALWPSAWPNLMANALAALSNTAQFKFDIDVLLHGEWVNARHLPPDYLPSYLVVKLPEMVLALFVLSLPLTAWGLVQALVNGDRERAFGYVALVLGVFFPVAFSLAVKSMHYDALRHFLFVLPPMAVLVGVGIGDVLGDALNGLRQRYAVVAGVTVMAGLAFPVVQMVALHPYAYTYYNRTAGGVQGAEGQSELDYWATSYREAAEWLRGAPVVPVTGPVLVYVCGPTDSAARFLPSRFEVVKDVHDADFFIAFSRWNCDALVEAPTLYTVERQGARLAAVKDLRDYFIVLGEMPNNIRINEDYPRYGQN